MISVSASALSDVRLCQRFFMFKKLAPIPFSPERQATLNFGRTLHKIAEAYHKNGATPPATNEGRSFSAGLRHNPKPLQYQVEGYFKMDVLETKYTGYIDLSAPGHVIDHKTSKNPLGAVDYLEPSTDFQGIIYSFYNMLVNEEVDKTHFTWIFYQAPKDGELPRNPKTTTRHHVYPRKRIVDMFFDNVHSWAQLAVRLRSTKPNPLDLPPTWESCSSYGGCPYKEKCGKPPLKEIL